MNLRNWGWLVTLIWLCFFFPAVLLNAPHFLTLDANEWGDFLAGAFAPLAFFWLVLGFFQQGKELQHSVDALNLQAKELRNSVEQQQELVNVNREAIKADRERLEAAKLERKSQIRPLFEPVSATISNRGNIYTYSYRIINNGERATNVHLKVTCDNAQHEGQKQWPFKDTSEYIEGKIRIENWSGEDFNQARQLPWLFLLSFKDRDGDEFTQQLQCVPQPKDFGNRLEWL
ncbi:hypothetical protein [Thalassovita sp.]|jgi:ribosomal protein L17|uniref:hypothetical protein n=1 Tax=Thalassovita sp. TaxID=1979401 RepID=UPI003B5A2660